VYFTLKCRTLTTNGLG